MPDILLLIDPETLRVGEANRDAFGYSRVELLALALPHLLPRLSRKEIVGRIATCDPLETVCRDKDGNDLAIDLRFGKAGKHVVAAIRDIGARVAVEEELERVNQFLEAVVENIPDMIFVKRAEDHMFIRFNRAGEQLLGWTRDELLGKTDHDFYPKAEADFFHAKDKETLRSGQLVDIAEEPITTKAKGKRWLHTKKIPVSDERGKPLYLLGISEDITARKEAEERLHAVERELASVVRDAREAIVAWSPEGTIVSFNPAAESLYGVAASRAIGAHVETLVPESLRAEFRKRQARVLGGEKLPIAEAYRLRSGQEIEVEESLFAIHDSAGAAVRVASIVRDISELARLRRATEILAGAERATPAGDEELSARMRETLSSAEAVAQDAHATVLLLGETGVGKSWLARRIHRASPRAQHQFFELNCASLEAGLLESELFGHERGAFTGATSQKRGIVEVAEGGTLFLDEVGELPPGVQAKLLTFLESRTFRRLGGTRAMQADVRLLAATNADLKDLVARGAFRRDLYFRLSVVPIEVPPLRERREEIPSLVRGVLHELARGRSRSVSRGAMSALRRYDWPGNVRELRNVLERALILGRGESIDAQHLSAEIQRGSKTKSSSVRLEDVERSHIRDVLASVQGNRTRAAELLGISRSTLKRKLIELGD
ncbi:MAG: sigma 54-interacting transcriptional regulator [Myxococcales bacterium]|nr:sigma 54-interacting transcriptional regulator [Myxococcales bacterium]